MVQWRHPNFSVKIELGEDAIPCFRHVPGARIPLRIVVGDELRWQPEIEKELATPFDAQQAPLVRAVVAHHANRAVLILAAHHSIADGKSLVFAIRDTLYALSGKMLVPLPAIASLDAVPSPNPSGIDYDELDQNSVLESAGKPYVYRENDGFAPRVRSRTLTPALTRKWRQRSREEETTVQCALITAAAEAARRISGELERAAIRVSSPVDFRTVIGAADEVAPLAGGVVVSMERDSHATFWDTARHVKRTIDPARTPEGFSRMMAQLGAFMSHRPTVTEVATFWAERVGFEINVSNLGEIPIESRIGPLKLEAVRGPSILTGFEGEQGIGVATTNGSLNLLHTSYKPLPLLLESIEQILLAACQ